MKKQKSNIEILRDLLAAFPESVHQEVIGSNSKIKYTGSGIYMLFCGGIYPKYKGTFLEMLNYLNAEYAIWAGHEYREFSYQTDAADRQVNRALDFIVDYMQENELSEDMAVSILKSKQIHVGYDKNKGLYVELWGGGYYLEPIKPDAPEFENLYKKLYFKI